MSEMPETRRERFEVLDRWGNLEGDGCDYVDRAEAEYWAHQRDVGQPEHGPFRIRHYVELRPGERIVREEEG